MPVDNKAYSASIKRDIEKGNWDDAECTFTELETERDRQEVLEQLRDNLAIGDFFIFTRNLICYLSRNMKEVQTLLDQQR